MFSLEDQITERSNEENCKTDLDFRSMDKILDYVTTMGMRGINNVDKTKSIVLFTGICKSTKLPLAVLIPSVLAAKSVANYLRKTIPKQGLPIAGIFPPGLEQTNVKNSGAA